MNNILSVKINILDSPATKITTKQTKDPIFLIYQFFVHPNIQRHKELQMALKNNIQNPFISKIYLLNERIYTDEELGTASPKIKQIVLGKRITFKNVFDFIHGDNLIGYCITCNADIFLDHTVSNLYKSGIDKHKSVYAQLRFDCVPRKTMGHGKLFSSAYKEPRGDSQDTWIIHSNFNLTKRERKLFDFQYGMRGCDNKITYLFYILGFTIINQPYFIKTYHLHNSGIRGYDVNSPLVAGPHLQIGPYIAGKTLEMASYPAPFNAQQHFKFDTKCYWNNKDNRLIDISHGNESLKKFLKQKLSKCSDFDHPPVWNIELLDPVIMKMIHDGFRLQKEENDIRKQIIVHELNQRLPLAKTSCGILIETNQDYSDYVNSNCGALESCDMCMGYTHLDMMWHFMGQAHIDIYRIFKMKNIPFISRDGLDIYQYIHSEPWTLQLKGKRLLIVAPYIEQIKERAGKKEIYGFDFFPDCTFTFMESPRTFKNNGTNKFQIETEQLANKIVRASGDFDIALLACNGYSGIMGSYIKKLGKCAITVGNLIYLWFGVYTKNDVEYRGDIIKLYQNKHWCQLDAPDSDSMFAYSW